MLQIGRSYCTGLGVRGGTVVKVLCYRLEGRVVLAWGPAVVQWLRCSATYWKVAGSIPAGVTGNFH